MIAAEFIIETPIWRHPNGTRESIVCHRIFHNPASTEQEGHTMKNPLDSLWGTIITGVILTAVLYFIVKNVLN